MNNIQSEQTLENNLIKQLQNLEYEYIKIKDEPQMLENLKTQIEIHNKTTLTEKEFEKVLNHLNKWNTFERSKILRDKMQLKKRKLRHNLPRIFKYGSLV